MGASIETIRDALSELNKIEETKLIKASSLYRTKPWGYKEQEDFINAACLLETTLSPLTLLHRMQEIEFKFHRERLFKYGPRTLDLDIIAFDKEVIKSKELELPHPQMHKRAFVLVPLAEIVPNYIIEPYHLSITALRDKLPKDALEEAQRCG